MTGVDQDLYLEERGLFAHLRTSAHESAGPNQTENPLATAWPTGPVESRPLPDRMNQG